MKKLRTFNDFNRKPTYSTRALKLLKTREIYIITPIKILDKGRSIPGYQFLFLFY